MWVGLGWRLAGAAGAAAGRGAKSHPSLCSGSSRHLGDRNRSQPFRRVPGAARLSPPLRPSTIRSKSHCRARNALASRQPPAPRPGGQGQTPRGRRQTRAGTAQTKREDDLKAGERCAWEREQLKGKGDRDRQRQNTDSTQQVPECKAECCPQGEARVLRGNPAIGCSWGRPEERTNLSKEDRIGLEV